MSRILLPAGGILLVLTVLFLLARPLVHSLGADRVVVELGIRAAPDERARLVDQHLLDSIESRAFGQELRLRLNRHSRQVSLKAFFIDTCEVRQIDFERFAKWYSARINSTAPSMAPSTGNTRPGNTSPEVPPDALVSLSTGHRVAGLLQSPATGVDFRGAALYCRTLGGRLPWAEELEAAASGQAGRLYAWGNTFDAGAWPYLDTSRNAARTCGTHPASDSPEGVHDLNSNAMEWSRGSLAASADAPEPAAHGAPAVRSRGRALYALNAAWLNIPASTRSHHLGFRCVYDNPPPERQPWGGKADPRALIKGGDYPVGLPSDVRLARLAVILPGAQLDGARRLLASVETDTTQLAIGRCEVNRSEYQAFLNDPLARSGLFANPQEPASENYLPNDWVRQLAVPDLPVSGVSWWAADAYTRWAGGRLPRATEWRLLAAGPAARRYPWGNEYDALAAVTADLPTHGLQVCAAPGLRDVNAAGVRHLAGNLSEWTQSITVDSGNYAIWVQGGNWLLPGQDTTHSAFGRLVPLNHRSPGIGFRVVYD